MYIVCKNFYGKSISGIVSLPVGTELILKDNVLLYQNKPICYNTSQNCYDYMADNSKGDGIERYNIIQDIKRVYANIIKKDNEAYMELVKDLTEEDTLPPYVSTLSFTITFNYEFYNKSKKELEDILGGLNIDE
jgi:hypothetical protein